ncbi:proline dehydrogenase family protein [Streptomyces sp. GS7]|uniref:proline dehydrogenase family protein n=1 Tax=Streptomyces sp. GS7 TaxID=2692234 RepID=UPI001915B482|nr:proline dehydrogenase family protein [Streptomyces sp. GS7]
MASDLPATATATATAEISAQAAQVLRRVALDEELKARVPQDPVLGPLVRKVAGRYVAGETLTDALDHAKRIRGTGHRTTVDYMGESCRAPQRATEATEVFLDAAGLLAPGCSLSLDLSRIGLVVDEELAPANATRIAHATAETNREMIISAEGSDRPDSVLALHRSLCRRFDHVGVTIQARLHRTSDDLQQLLALPGRIRLVKGSARTVPSPVPPADQWRCPVPRQPLRQQLQVALEAVRTLVGTQPRSAAHADGESKARRNPAPRPPTPPA